MNPFDKNIDKKSDFQIELNNLFLTIIVIFSKLKKNHKKRRYWNRSILRKKFALLKKNCILRRSFAVRKIRKAVLWTGGANQQHPVG